MSQFIVGERVIFVLAEGKHIDTIAPSYRRFLDQEGVVVEASLGYSVKFAETTKHGFSEHHLVSAMEVDSL